MHAVRGHPTTGAANLPALCGPPAAAGRGAAGAAQAGRRVPGLWRPGRRRSDTLRALPAAIPARRKVGACRSRAGVDRRRRSAGARAAARGPGCRAASCAGCAGTAGRSGAGSTRKPAFDCAGSRSGCAQNAPNPVTGRIGATAPAAVSTFEYELPSTPTGGGIPIRRNARPNDGAGSRRGCAALAAGPATGRIGATAPDAGRISRMKPCATAKGIPNAERNVNARIRRISGRCGSSGSMPGCARAAAATVDRTDRRHCQRCREYEAGYRDRDTGRAGAPPAARSRRPAP